MDRFNGSSYNTGHYYDHYYDHYYSQAYQEGGQHAFQPEAGQTSAGVPASGALGNYPVEGQSYLNPNLQAQIPSPPQPTPLAKIIQNDVRSNAQPAVKSRHRKPFAEVKEHFMASLEKYAQGDTLDGCSTTIQLSAYITDAGNLRDKGKTLYNKLDKKDKDQVDQALADRQVFYSHRPYSDNSTRTRIMEGLEAYVSGVSLKNCSKTISFPKYFTDDGKLAPQGQALYKGLEQEDKDRIDQALEARKESRPVNTHIAFLESLEAYASGAPIMHCSETITFHAYASARGYLHKRGIDLYNKLEEQDKNRVIDALNARREFYYGRITTNDIPIESFLAGLEAYASGAQLKDCSATIDFPAYVSANGNLQLHGKILYSELGKDEKIQVDQALAARRRMAAQRMDLRHFLDALVPYSIGLDLQECGEQSGLKRKAKTYLTPEGGLTTKGERLIESLPLEEQIEVLSKVEKRRRLIDPNAQEPASPWQLPEMPSSMPEMEWTDQVKIPDMKWMDQVEMPNMEWVDQVEMPNMEWMDQVEMPDMKWMDQVEMPDMEWMDQVEMYDPMQTEVMYDPMQTEAMMAAAWQYTGQAMPGTWGIPSESAESSIPHYGRDVVGTDFQHRYDSNGLMSQRAPDCLIGRGIVHDTLINILGEEYRVHDTGQRSVNPTNENPLGNIFVLVPRM
ncbi:MAG: hypothetical protein P8X89_24525, partial [Reinekea sp.]